MINTFRLAITTLSLIVLVACGGGAGNTASTPTPTETQLPQIERPALPQSITAGMTEDAIAESLMLSAVLAFGYRDYKGESYDRDSHLAQLLNLQQSRRGQNIDRGNWGYMLVSDITAYKDGTELAKTQNGILYDGLSSWQERLATRIIRFDSPGGIRYHATPMRRSIEIANDNSNEIPNADYSRTFFHLFPESWDFTDTTSFAGLSFNGGNSQDHHNFIGRGRDRWFHINNNRASIETITTPNNDTIFKIISNGFPSFERTGYRFQSFGSWLDAGSVFTAEILTLTGRDDIPADTWIYGTSLGDASDSNPTGTGTARWSGIMIGAEATTTGVNVFQGIAVVDIDDLANPDVDVVFSNIKNINDSVDKTIMGWDNLPLTSGTFTGTGIEGRFYGEIHNEVGGVFERDDVIGAFGASR